MQKSDDARFKELLAGAGEEYKIKFSAIRVQMWWKILKPYTIEQVEAGIYAHMRDPDAGMFELKTASIIKHIDGTKKDNNADAEFMAEAAWLSIPKAIRGVGQYGTPQFNDPITTACVSTMTWKAICNAPEGTPWMQKKFVEHYQTFSKKPFDQLPNNIQGLEGVKKLNEFSTVLTQLSNLKVEK
ncbi:MAG: hypothetical protein ACJASL_000141 [Paraglaciecola sp.]|jgi:hypothetical protein